MILGKLAVSRQFGNANKETFELLFIQLQCAIILFNSSGFMHAHVSYLTEDCPACLLMLTVERDAFFELSAAKQKIVTVSIVTLVAYLQKF